MNRKQKIIVSITGIFLVLMILVGLTYAYFLTRITGNTNDKSISVTTANLVLEYGENTNVVQGINNAEPGYSVEKIFTATNKGNSTVIYGAALESIVNELTRQEDLVYTLTCTSYLKEGFSLANDGTITGTVDGTCNGVTTEKQFPSTSTMSVMTTNTIDTLHTHAYKITVTYKEMGEDQSTDMNKTFSARVNIVDLRASAELINPYSENKNALNYKIINSALNGENDRTVYGGEITRVDAPSRSDEKVLNTATDDYGTSYYYRGNVIDNYVNYAGMCWRIVRIQGDGSIKLILASEKVCSEENLTDTSGLVTDSSGSVMNVHYGYKIIGTKYINDYINNSGNVTNDARTKLNEWLEEKIVTNDNVTTSQKQLLKNEDWCIGDRTSAYDTTTGEKRKETADDLINNATAFNYSIGERVKTYQPSLVCDGSKEKEGEIDTNKVGLLTADEIRLAGGYSGVVTENFYLSKNSVSVSWLNISINNFTGTKDYINFFVNGNRLAAVDVNAAFALRPTISILSSAQISSGNGTISNPYTIE